MASPTSLSSSSFAYQWTYDVFLSFRGEDTRTGFTGNLYHALREKGVNTFIDDKLRKGEKITPALMKAIQESRIAIVVFSQNYASSCFCLQELTEIMECLKPKGRLVWPVFYNVDPSDVRHQTGSYGEALTKHETRNHDKDKVNKWRSALREAANLSGLHYKHGYEYEFIGEIIQEICKRISRQPLYVAKYPVGLESRAHKVMSLLDVKSRFDVKSNDRVHMVGIYGIGGIGKTTLACAVYNFIADQFEGLSFLADIRENSMKHGLVHLQETLLSDILGEKDIKLGNIWKGIPMIKSRLCRKKILLILDDVDEKEHLDKLAGGLDWFGSGSRIIITTRDAHLLHAYGVQRTYEVEGLNDGESLELFRWNAFTIKGVDPSYQGISERVIRHSNGLPLSVEIIGSDLFGKSVSECNSALDAYEKIPPKNIQKILRVSYDSLEELEKEVFLDMACFFKGCSRTDVIGMLHRGRGYNPEYHIRVLTDKCLIQIANGYVRMHNLIETMGKEIVRQESPKPGERSRLWFSEDTLNVLKKNKGSDKTKIIILHLPKEEDVWWDGNALRKMENLKILVVKNARFSRAPTALPNSLRVLIWWGYPESSSLPADFDVEELVILDLPRSFITFENQLNMKFKSLTNMNFSGCDLLKKVPDMSGASNLEKLELRDCKYLLEVHDSVGFLDKLKWLDLSNCTSLRILPREINLTSLESMDLVNCTSLMSFPEVSGKMENMKMLVLNGSGIRDLPFSIGNITGLQYLFLHGCKWLLELPISIFMLPYLKGLVAKDCYELAQIQNGNSQDQETMCSYSSHSASCHQSFPRHHGVAQITPYDSNSRVANFIHCYLTDKFLATLIPCLRNVTCLSLCDSNITILPSSISTCLSLTSISLDECKELREIRGLPPNVMSLSLRHTNITILPSSISACLSLTSVSLDECKELREIRGLPPNIKYFSAINCTSLTSESKGMLLNQTLHEAGGRHFIFPGSIIIPSWLNFISRGPSLRFWFRDKFPAITLCVNSGFYFSLIVNGVRVVDDSLLRNNTVPTKHTILSDKLFYFNNNYARSYLKRGWNSAEIFLRDYPRRKIDAEWGVRVWEQETNKEDIEFTNPDTSVEEKQFLNQFSTADREGARPSSLSGYMEQMECTENSPESDVEAQSTALSNKKRKHNDDL